MIIPEPTPRTVTRLLRAWRDGDRQAIDGLLPLVYERLRRLARRYLRSERAGHTLQTTELVHEAYLQLVGADIPWKDRAHFYAVAARAMRRILVDHARARSSVRRGRGTPPVALDEALVVSARRPDYLLDLDDALTRLALQDERKGQLVEMHFFGGLTFEELTRAFGLSLSTIEREMRLARAWLRRDLSGTGTYAS